MYPQYSQDSSVHIQNFDCIYTFDDNIGLSAGVAIAFLEIYWRTPYNLSDLNELYP
jgi:hypothetical protein